jgi:hypothetical protein
MTDPTILYNSKPPTDVFICYEQLSCNGQHVLTVLLPESIVNWLRTHENNCISLEHKDQRILTHTSNGGWCSDYLRIVAEDARPGREWYFEYVFQTIYNGDIFEDVSAVLHQYKSLLQAFRTKHTMTMQTSPKLVV